jgi:uncharacterized protein
MWIQPMSPRRKSPSHPSAGHVVLVGTQVVTLSNTKSPEGALLHKSGAIAVIIEAPSRPSGQYLVRFPDGSIALLTRGSFEARKQRPKSFLSLFRTPPHDLFEFVIYRCVVGPSAYGLNDSDSAPDRRGIYLPPADKHWSLWGLPEQLERRDSQECYWELEKFLRLALRANPVALECLYTPLVEIATPLAKELLAMRSVFLTRIVYHTYNNILTYQFKEFSRDRRSSGRVRWKHGARLIRLLLSGITILNERQLPLELAAHRDKLLAIHRGQCDWKELDSWRKQLHKDFDAALAKTTLPEHPDFDRVNSFLLKARRSML